MKIQLGHLHGGKAPIFSTVPVLGTIGPFVPGQKVAVTFYLNGHKLLTRNVDVRKVSGETGARR